MMCGFLQVLNGSYMFLPFYPTADPDRSQQRGISNKFETFCRMCLPQVLFGDSITQQQLGIGLKMQSCPFVL